MDIFIYPRIITVCGNNDSPELLKNVKTDVLVHEATYTDKVLLKVGTQVQHSSAKKVAEFSESIGLKNLVLTHFSARYTYENISDISDEAKLYYTGKLFLANDFDIYHLDKQHNLKKLE
ncbi:MAG: hypothetical protein HQL46_00850 [Gammaproteobacteria bacterium]|nr:hypothetical protein [Gammaproteobacteria bacterium]